MKKTILLPLALGLVLAGCSRTQSESNKVSANDQNDPNKPTYQDSAITARNTTADQSKVAANPTPSPTPSKEPMTAMPSPDNPVPMPNPVAASETTPAGTTAASATTRDGDITARIAEWHLSANDIRSEVEGSGQVVRSRMAGVNEPTGPMDEQLSDQIASKFRDNAAIADLSLKAKADKGTVTLSGSAESLDQIGTAMALSLDTPGVTKTISEIKLNEKKP